MLGPIWSLQLGLIHNDTLRLLLDAIYVWYPRNKESHKGE